MIGLATESIFGKTVFQGRKNGLCHIVNAIIKTIELLLHGKGLPINRNVKGNSDLLLRELDCAVIQRIHQYNREQHNKSYDSVRGIFIEGNPVYPQSGIMEKSHVQLCIVNPNCIKGYFSPLLPDREWDMV